MDNRWLILFPIGIGAILLLTEKNHEESTQNPSTGKEAYYLRFNKDEIMKNLVATEEHFRNVSDDPTKIRKGSLACVVKHLISAEGHGDEAISHSLVADNEETSKNFRELRNNIRELRREVQQGISPEKGIVKAREIRRKFESFNPEFDISQCEACTIQVEIIKPQGGSVVSSVESPLS